MNSIRIRIAAIAAALLATVGLVASPAGHADDKLNQNEVRQLREAGKILPMEDILSRSRAAQPGQIVEVELDRENGRYVYEVKLIDDRNTVHKLELDAASGEVLRRKQK